MRSGSRTGKARAAVGRQRTLARKGKSKPPLGEVFLCPELQKKIDNLLQEIILWIRSEGRMAENYELFDELEGILGTDQANQLVDHYGGSNIYIPKHPFTAQRHIQIRKEFNEGAGYRELSRRYSYTERNIRYIVHGRK
jgi:Mor family transcriptional regulator